MVNQDQIKELIRRVFKLEEVLNIKSEIVELKKKHLISQDSDFWSDQKNAEKLKHTFEQKAWSKRGSVV